MDFHPVETAHGPSLAANASVRFAVVPLLVTALPHNGNGRGLGPWGVGALPVVAPRRAREGVGAQDLVDRGQAEAAALLVQRAVNVVDRHVSLAKDDDQVNASPSNTQTLLPGMGRLSSSREISARDAPNSSRLSVSPYCKSRGILPDCHP